MVKVAPKKVAPKKVAAKKVPEKKVLKSVSKPRGAMSQKDLKSLEKKHGKGYTDLVRSIPKGSKDSGHMALLKEAKDKLQMAPTTLPANQNNSLQLS